MTRDQAVAVIKRGLGFITTTEQDDNIVSALQSAQRLLEKGRSLPLFLLQEDETAALSSGSNAVSFPTGFLREKQEERFHFTDSDTNAVIYLEKVTLEEGNARFATDDAGKPRAYAVRKDTFVFYPDQDAAYTLYWSYFKRGTELTSNVENEWLDDSTGEPEILIGRAGMLLAEDMKNPTAYQKFQSMYQTAWMGAFADDILRADEADPIRVGGRL